MEGSLVGEAEALKWCVDDVQDRLRLCGCEFDVNAIALACSRFQQVQLVAIDEGCMVEKCCHAVTSSRYDVKTTCLGPVSRPP